MYTELLKIAVDEGPQPDSTLSPGVALTVLHQRRHRLHVGKGRNSGVSSALSDQLDYDVALITLAGLLGISTDIHSFDVPQKERSRLELALSEKGILLDGVGAAAPDGLQP